MIDIGQNNLVNACSNLSIYMQFFIKFHITGISLKSVKKIYKNWIHQTFAE